MTYYFYYYIKLLKFSIIIISGAALVCFNAEAQSSLGFADSTARWQILISEYSMVPPFSVYRHTEDYRVLGDSMVLSTSYQIIQGLGLGEIGRMLVRQDSTKRVFYLDYQQENLLFDFNLEVDDTFWIEQNNPFLRVDSVDTVNWGGAKKRMFLSCISVSCHYDEVWVEGVGNLNPSGYSPFSRSLIIDGPTYELLCYSENDTILYTNPDYQVCHIDTTIYLAVENIPQQNLIVSPNPCHSVLNIIVVNTSIQFQSIRLLSVTGQEFISAFPASNTQHVTFHTEHLPLSIYFCYITLSNGEKVVRKVVVE